jgi:hypothetical protein
MPILQPNHRRQLWLDLFARMTIAIFRERFGSSPNIYNLYLRRYLLELLLLTLQRALQLLLHKEIFSLLWSLSIKRESHRGRTELG